MEFIMMHLHVADDDASVVAVAVVAVLPFVAVVEEAA